MLRVENAGVNSKKGTTVRKPSKCGGGGLKKCLELLAYSCMVVGMFLYGGSV